MDIHKRVKKTQAYSRAMVGLYFNAEKKLALLRPILSDETLMQRYNNRSNFAAHGLEFFQFTLFLDVAKDAVALTLDRDKRAASLRNVLRLLGHCDVREELRDAYCTPLPFRWDDTDLPEDAKQALRQSHEDAVRKGRAKDFDNRYALLTKQIGEVLGDELAQRLQKARNKLITHYQMTRAGEEPRLVTPEDLGLEWGDAEAYLEAVAPLIFDAELLINNASYDVEQFEDNHARIGSEFWSVEQTAS